MSKLNVSSIFYSKSNIKLAYDLKTIGREFGISVIYAFNVPELVRFLNEIKMDVIFIDCKTLHQNDNIIPFIKSNSNSKTSILIGVDDDNCLQTHHEIDFVITSNSLSSSLQTIQEELLTKIAKNNSDSYDINALNTFVSDYLLSVGFVPKHAGFHYIKQVVQIAIKHGMIGSLNKDVYPVVASIFKTLPQNVERNIRNAIECACKSKEIQQDAVAQLLYKGKISNRAFLSFLLDKTLNEFGKR